MKTYLVPTDFSEAATGAARYATKLAGVMNATVKLCHAVDVAADPQTASQLVWPHDGYQSAYKTAATLLERTRGELAGEIPSGMPKITSTYDNGFVTDLVNKVVAEDKTNLVIMGVSGANAISRFILGSNSKAGNQRTRLDQ